MGTILALQWGQSWHFNGDNPGASMGTILVLSIFCSFPFFIPDSYCILPETLGASILPPPNINHTTYGNKQKIKGHSIPSFSI